uniref:O-methyltransferase dimerisation domain-containing protein n=1 Tax=Nelumbo nucifera TaxID=4432 RepID=A0A822YTP4_NELNU|nr:TPA_asm: hypothetical protein HUJ06_006547 [Nelumbo nucifera]
MNSITTQLPTSEEDENHCLFAMQLASASVLPMVLKAAMELNVLEIIAREGPGAHLSPLEIAAHLSTQNPEAPVLLDRILRLLASHSVLTCSLHQTHGDGRV